MLFFVVDYQLDSGGKEDLRHGPYATEELAVKAAKDRWCRLGVAVSRRVGDELCEADGSPVCRLELEKQ